MNATTRNSMTRYQWLAVASAMTLLVMARVDAAILGTYVDASTSGVGSNTGPATAFTGGQNSFDNLWWDRPLAGFNLQNNTVIEATGGENAPELTTTVTGLSSGTYDVYVLYWTFLGSPATDQGIAAALGADPLVEYWRADGSSFSTGIKHPDDTTTELYEVKLGTFTGNSFTVRVDHAGSSPSGVSDERTWYDGVAYVLVPEPTSTLLFGVGGLILWLRRRR
jgi:hypothetical protein